MSTAYFTPQTFHFLDRLAAHNERPWFKAHQDEYEVHVREPFLALIADLAEPLATISPHFRADPRKLGGSLFRIQRDVRFSNNKQPYKTWAGARLFHERRRERPAPSFYLHIQRGHCFVGGGIWHPESKTLRTLRDFIVDNPAAWTRTVHNQAFERRFQFWGESLVRAPCGYDPDHPLIEDLKRKSLAVGTSLDDERVCNPQLQGTIVRNCKALAPMIDYLCVALALEF